MFVRQPQFRNASADVQIFYGDADAATSTLYRKSWNKPPGVSHVYMMLIGAGGTGGGTDGGGCGAVTVWYGAAQNVPDSLLVQAARSGVQTASEIYYRGSDLVTLLSASSGLNAGGGSAMTANAFAASGFFQSINGVSGSNAAFSPQSATFLSPGGNSGTSTANYGYRNQTSQGNGYFMLQPIIVGVGALGGGRGGIGCGGGNNSGQGGQGMVLIASW